MTRMRKILLILIAVILGLLVVFFAVSRIPQKTAGTAELPGASYVKAREEKNAADALAVIRSARAAAQQEQHNASEPGPAEQQAGPVAEPDTQQAEPAPAPDAQQAETDPEPGEQQDGSSPDPGAGTETALTDNTEPADDIGGDAAAAAAADLVSQIDSLNIRPLTTEEIAQYRSRYDTTVVIGDSMAQAVLEYGLLDAGHVKYLRSASISQLSDQINEALAMLPDHIIFFTGLNDVDIFAADPAGFYAAYLQQTESILAFNPSIKVSICSLLPPSDALAAARPDLARAPEFDAQIRQVCADSAAEYIDCTWMVRQELYLADQMHFNEEFYMIWLQYAALCAGI